MEGHLLPGVARAMWQFCAAFELAPFPERLSLAPSGWYVQCMVGG